MRLLSIRPSSRSPSSTILLWNSATITRRSSTGGNEQNGQLKEIYQTPNHAPSPGSFTRLLALGPHSPSSGCPEQNTSFQTRAGASLVSPSIPALDFTAGTLVAVSAKLVTPAMSGAPLYYLLPTSLRCLIQECPASRSRFSYLAIARESPTKT